MKSNTELSGLDIPIDLLKHMLSMLNFLDKISCRRVCVSWNKTLHEMGNLEFWDISDVDLNSRGTKFSHGSLLWLEIHTHVIGNNGNGVLEWVSKNIDEKSSLDGLEWLCKIQNVNPYTLVVTCWHKVNVASWLMDLTIHDNNEQRGALMQFMLLNLIYIQDLIPDNISDNYMKWFVKMTRLHKTSMENTVRIYKSGELLDFSRQVWPDFYHASDLELTMKTGSNLTNLIKHVDNIIVVQILSNDDVDLFEQFCLKHELSVTEMLDLWKELLGATKCLNWILNTIETPPYVRYVCLKVSIFKDILGCGDFDLNNKAWTKLNMRNQDFEHCEHCVLFEGNYEPYVIRWMLCKMGFDECDKYVPNEIPLHWPWIDLCWYLHTFKIKRSQVRQAISNYIIETQENRDGFESILPLILGYDIRYLREEFYLDRIFEDAIKNDHIPTIKTLAELSPEKWSNSYHDWSRVRCYFPDSLEADFVTWVAMRNGASLSQLIKFIKEDRECGARWMFKLLSEEDRANFQQGKMFQSDIDIVSITFTESIENYDTAYYIYGDKCSSFIKWLYDEALFLRKIPIQFETVSSIRNLSFRKWVETRLKIKTDAT